MSVALVVPHAKATSWPAEPDRAASPEAQHLPLALALTADFATDVHVAGYGPGPGEQLGHLHCLRAHCARRASRDVRDVFTRAELDDARSASRVAA